MSKQLENVGRGQEKSNCLQSIPKILPNFIRPRTGTIVRFDWLVHVARQLKSGIRNLTFVHNPKSGTLEDQNTYDPRKRSNVLFRKR